MACAPVSQIAVTKYCTNKLIIEYLLYGGGGPLCSENALFLPKMEGGPSVKTLQ